MANSSDIITINILSDIEHIGQMKHHALACMESIFGSGKCGAESDMMPTMLSATGNNPPTHCLCSMKSTSNILNRMVAYRNANGCSFCRILAGAKTQVLADLNLKEIN